MSFNRKQGDRRKRRVMVSDKTKYVSDAASSRRSEKQKILMNLDKRDE